MDIFRFNNPNAATRMEDGVFLNNLRSTMWIERYASAGEFKITGYAGDGIKEALPRGSFISHTETDDIMIVEDHEINDTKGKETLVTVTGRSFESYLDNRVVGSNTAIPYFDNLLMPDYTWNQAVELIKNYIHESRLADPGDAIPHVEVHNTVVGYGESELRVVKRGGVYTRLLEILAIDDLGIKTVRPNPTSIAGNKTNTALVIHKGVDRSNTVVFSYESGEIESGDYFWSDRKLKNCATITGRWVRTFVTTTDTGYNRRQMFVDGTDIDGDYEVAPTGELLVDITNAMRARGLEALASQNRIALVKVDVSKDVKKAIYRKDYNVGDTITVRGDYNEEKKMRVTEYVEIEDQNGSSGYPTLANV